MPMGCMPGALRALRTLHVACSCKAGGAAGCMPGMCGAPGGPTGQAVPAEPGPIKEAPSERSAPY